MQLNGKSAVIFIPDGLEEEAAWSRTTHMGIGAHPDDLEFMAWSGIISGLAPKNRFAGVTLTDGGGSSRIGPYANTDDASMRRIRLEEEKKAAFLGEYSALAVLGYTSAQVRRDQRDLVKEDIKVLIKAARPQVIYTHNLADRGEVWRSLDWLASDKRCSFDVSSKANLNMSLMGLYDSQIEGGKNYHEATLGRKRANATYADAYAADKSRLLELFMNLHPLLENPQLSPLDYLAYQIDAFKTEALNSLKSSC